MINTIKNTAGGYCNHLLVILCTFLGAGANAQPGMHRYTFTHPQMGTVFKLVFYSEKDSLEATAIATKVFDRVDVLNSVFSDYQPESELSKLSDTAGSGKKVTVSDDLWKILKLSDKYSRASDGAFDITVGALTRLWRKSRHMQELPDSSRIQAALSTVDYRSIRFYRRHKVLLKNKGTRLDLGGIAQGYAADECLNILKSAGIPRALADAGGDIALGDAPPGLAGWTIERATTTHDSITGKEIMVLANCGITTSGAQYRYFESGGVRYSHIVDPRTGWGMTHRHLVTVKAPTAVQADAWATALSVLRESEWQKIQPRQKELTVWIAIMKL